MTRAPPIQAPFSQTLQHHLLVLQANPAYLVMKAHQVLMAYKARQVQKAHQVLV
jgi:hypothetical protein